MRPTLALSLVLAALVSCSEQAPDGVPIETVVQRERIAALFEEDSKREALDLARPLADAAEAELVDLLSAAVLELHLDDGLEAAIAYGERARALDPTSAAACFVLGQAYYQFGELERAVERFGEAHRLAPDDVPSRLMFANMLGELDRPDEALSHYRAILEEDANEWGSWMVTAAYRLGRIVLRQDDEAGYEAARLREEELRESYEAPSPTDQLKGELGRIPFLPPLGTLVLGPAQLATSSMAGPDLAGCENVAAWTLGPEWTLPERDDTTGAVVSASSIGRPDLVGWGSGGLRVAHAEGEREWRMTTLLEDPVDAAWPIDWDDDGWLDFALLVGGELVLRRYDSDTDALTDGPVHPEAPAAPHDAMGVDYDHDGDIDLLLVGSFGARIWRNDGLHQLDTEGAPEGETARTGAGAFTDATDEAGLPVGTSFDWCLAEDFDTDQDVDLLLGSSQTLFLADNLRGGRFADRSAALGGADGSSVAPIAGDLDGDSLPDLWFAADTARVLRGSRSGSFQGESAGGSAQFDHPASFGDLDLDGSADATWATGGAIAGRLALGLDLEGELEVEADGGVTSLAAADVDVDGTVELVAARAGSVELISLATDRGSFRLALQGDKDNFRGRGAIVEVRAGPIYRRLWWSGQPQTVGIGDRAAADIVRITWPNGVVQHAFDVASGSAIAVKQVERLAGSCPFLYTWNGLTYEFVSDVLGITPLGLPMMPGMLVPPDHDEYVLIRGEQLRPRHDQDGLWYDMQVTEELREVTYLDYVKLLVVDHPEGSELFPNERFSFPPFPERHEHVVSDILEPVRANGSDGSDWAESLAHIDGRYALPFDGYQDQFQGLAPPWTIEVEFDPAQIRSGERLRLLCTGWLLWTNASVNMAAGRTPGVDFVPPILQVPAAVGEEAPDGWRSTGPPVGFPAGKTKTMVLDVTDLIDPANPRLRLFSTLCLYWDSIRLAVGDDAATRIVELMPDTANLWERGFSDTIVPSGEYKLEWFLWDRLMAEPPWNQHPGFYTKLGETLPLLTDIDDIFVVMGAGDSLRLRFDASGVAPVEDGWRRDFLLFLDGWAKDRDPNTIDALEVEPFPFHGMSGYPYGADEAFPDTEEHRRWRKEWQVRPARSWIEPVAPRAGI